jgi:hypothetical protein
VPLDAKAGATRQKAGEILHAAIREFHHPAAGPTDKVMAMPFCDGGVMAVPVVHADVCDESQSSQKAHGSVDTGEPNAGFQVASATVHLGNLEVLRGVGKDAKDGQTRPRQFQSLDSKRLRESRGGHGGPLIEKYSQRD